MYRTDEATLLAIRPVNANTSHNIISGQTQETWVPPREGKGRQEERGRKREVPTPLLIFFDH